MWVNSEYASELAVLSAWLGALVPWNVHRIGIAAGSSLYVRFPLFQVQFSAFPDFFEQTGIELPGGIWVSDPFSAVLAPQGTDLILGIYGVNLAWAAGAVAILAALVLSGMMYVDEEYAGTLLPVDPVRLMGGLLGLSALVFGYAAYQIWSTGIPGTPIPVGVVVLALLSVMLLTVDRTDPSPEADAESA